MRTQYWVARESSVTFVRKTLPVTYKQPDGLAGLVTLSLAIPLVSWMQIIASRRIVHHLTSPASSLLYHLKSGYHHPNVLAADHLYQLHKSDDGQDMAHEDWDRLHDLIAYYIDGVNKTYQIDPELIAHILPATRLVKGIATGTLDAWRSLDAAQLLDGTTIVRAITDAIDNAEWVRSDIHVPVEPEDGETDEARKKLLKKQPAHMQSHAAVWKSCPNLSPFIVSANDVVVQVERSQQFWRNDFMAWEPARM